MSQPMEWSDKVKPVPKIKKTESQFANSECKADDSCKSDVFVLINIVNEQA